jgi:hypothetical protein
MPSTSSSSASSTKTSSSVRRTTDLKVPVKSDGTKDRRFSTAQFVKKDGTRDMRTTLTGNR